jgi:competence protein ComEC
MIKYYRGILLIALVLIPRLLIFYRHYEEESFRDRKEISFTQSKAFVYIRNKSIEVSRKYLPSPHSELVLGMVIGIDEFSKLPVFKQMLKDTGTIHVVVVSGFNITLVFNLVMKILGTKYKLKNMIMSEIVVLFYSLLSGFESPVVRSLIMGSVAAWGKYYGMGVGAFRLLIFSAQIMLLINPAYLVSLSFQLSFLATLGLILYEPLVKNFLQKIFGQKNVFSESLFFDDLCSSLSAQIFVLPLLSNVFGTVSVISPLVNCLILWTVSLATLIGFALIMSGFVNIFLTKVFSFIIYPLLDIFVRGVEVFSDFKFVNLNYRISTKSLIYYYLFVCLFCLLKFRKSQKNDV